MLCKRSAGPGPVVSLLSWMSLAPCRECMVAAAQLADGYWYISADVRSGSTCVGTFR